MVSKLENNRFVTWSNLVIDVVILALGIVFWTVGATSPFAGVIGGLVVIRQLIPLVSPVLGLFRKAKQIVTSDCLLRRQLCLSYLADLLAAGVILIVSESCATPTDSSTASPDSDLSLSAEACDGSAVYLGGLIITVCIAALALVAYILVSRLQHPSITKKATSRSLRTAEVIACVLGCLTWTSGIATINGSVLHGFVGATIVITAALALIAPLALMNEKILGWCCLAFGLVCTVFLIVLAVKQDVDGAFSSFIGILCSASSYWYYLEIGRTLMKEELLAHERHDPTVMKSKASIEKMSEPPSASSDDDSDYLKGKRQFGSAETL